MATEPALAATGDALPAGSRATWYLGLCCIVFVAVVWTLATVLKQVIFNDFNFDEPLVLAYVCNACYVIHLPIQAVALAARRSTGSTSTSRHCGEERVAGLQRHFAGRRGAAKAGALIAPLWFMAQWTYSTGVASTTVTSSTVISTTSVVWTLLGSYLFLGERLTPAKMLGVALCMGGNVAILWGNDSSSGSSGHQGNLWGDLLCIVAAMLYAVYTTMLKMLTGPTTSVSILFGTLGSIVLVFVTPLAFAFRGAALRGVSSEVFGLLIFNGMFDNVLSQFAWAKAVQWTSPTTATVGLSLTIPMSVLADYVRKSRLTGWSFVAAVLVVLGFVVVTRASEAEAGDESRKARPRSAPAACADADGRSETPLRGAALLQADA